MSGRGIAALGAQPGLAPKRLILLHKVLSFLWRGGRASRGWRRRSGGCRWENRNVGSAAKRLCPSYPKRQGVCVIRRQASHPQLTGNAPGRSNGKLLIVIHTNTRSRSDRSRSRPLSGWWRGLSVLRKGWRCQDQHYCGMRDHFRKHAT